MRFNLHLFHWRVSVTYLGGNEHQKILTCYPGGRVLASLGR